MNCPTDPNGQAACMNGGCVLMCSNGYHQCGNRCASNKDLATCGPSECMNPCVAPANGGTVACDGLACNPACPNGSKLCSGSCIPMNVACNGVCPNGQHACSGICQPDDSTSYCGAGCVSCTTPANGAAKCAAGSCDVVCDNMFKKCPGTSLCIANSGCCADGDCPTGPSGTVQKCTSAHVCTYPCDSTHHMCSDGTCISNANCCSDTECQSPTPICDASRTCAKRPNGMACSTDAECTSGTCPLCYRDKDGDGFGDKWSSPLARVCGPCTSGYVADGRDCMDDPNVFASANAVNPNAGFHSASAPPPFNTYTPDARDTSPDPWDWNCDDVRTLEITARAVGGCAAGATCSNSCPTDPQTVPTTPDTCGGYVESTGCINLCSSGGGCSPGTVGSTPQGCK